MSNYNFKLVDNTYFINDGKDILISLIDDKIKFLNRQISSLREQFNGGTERLERRIEELKFERKELNHLLDQFQGDDAWVEIDCQVKLKIKENKLLTAES